MPKVIVVDDDKHLREIYKKNLETRGYKAETAVDGLDALEKIGDFNPDIIILDIMMPKMDGIEVLKSLKNNPKFKSKPVLMLTGVSDVDRMKLCLDLGAMGYILKGTSIEEIDKRLKMLVGN